MCGYFEDTEWDIEFGEAYEIEAENTAFPISIYERATFVTECFSMYEARIVSSRMIDNDEYLKGKSEITVRYTERTE